MAIEDETPPQVKAEKQEVTKTQLTKFWKDNIAAANRVYSAWANRFQVYNLYQYYEGFQWIGDTDVYNRPYVVNMIYSTIEAKLPNLIFDNPEFNIRPRPTGIEFNFQDSAERSQIKEDLVNYVCRRKNFNLNDKHELAALDAFFGFGIIEIGFSEEVEDNPYKNLGKYNNPIDSLYCKHIPFDHFRVAPQANWDLSEGKWWGYYEFIPDDRLRDKYNDKLSLNKAPLMSADSEAAQWAVSGKITVSEIQEELCPANHHKIWHLWDFERGKYIKFADDALSNEDCILEYEDFTSCGICTLRYGKRRKGWYPMPPVFQWISPQDEINDIRQTHKIHRKRYQRKYQILENSIDQEEEDKFLYGPDGTCFKVKRQDAIKSVEDAPLDTSNQQSLIVSYDDFLRVAGGQTEQGRIADRTTATQATINNRLAQIRESKDLIAVGNFMIQIGNAILRELRNAKDSFFAEIGAANESLLGEIQAVRTTWKKISPELLQEDDYELDVKINSVSPVYQQEDKKIFMEFLALITQYEILSFSPGLLREAAYRVGYKNEAVLNQFQQLAQLAAIGRQVQLKGQVQQLNAPQGMQPRQLAEQQVNNSTPPDNQEIMNTIFNRQGMQPAQ